MHDGYYRLVKPRKLVSIDVGVMNFLDKTLKEKCLFCKEADYLDHEKLLLCQVIALLVFFF